MGRGLLGERVDPFDRSPAGYLTGAVSEPRGGGGGGGGGPYRSNTPPICHADLHVLRRAALLGDSNRRRGVGRSLPVTENSQEHISIMKSKTRENKCFKPVALFYGLKDKPLNKTSN